jgi:RecA-family ATPase
LANEKCEKSFVEPKVYAKFNQRIKEHSYENTVFWNFVVVGWGREGNPVSRTAFHSLTRTVCIRHCGTVMKKN